MKCSVAMQCVLVPAVVVCLFTLAAAEEAEHSVTAAFAWLEQSQDLESGFWGPDPVRDTAAVLQTVQLFPGSGIDVSAAQEYLSAQQPVSSDYLARKIMALDGDTHGVAQDVSELVLRQNIDGGFGFLDGYPSACIDSLMVLDALVLAAVDDAVIGSALEYLTALQHSSGAFPYGRSGPASLEVTCRALFVMHSLQLRYNLSSFIAQAAGFIATQHNADGGFGEDGSTVVETAFAIRALQAAGSNAQAVLEARTYLVSAQNPVDGSWNGRVQDTACALTALHASAGIDRANLQVHPSGISLQPSYPAVGQQVIISCEVCNTGSRAAENIEIELYLGDPQAGGQLLDNGIIALLAAGGSTSVQWSFVLTDEPGHADLYVIVDPRNLIPETSTADNMAVKHFTSGTLPDLTIARIDLSTVSPLADQPFTISAEVQNLGESDAGSVNVGLYDGNPANTIPLLEVTINNVCGGCSSRADFELTLPAGTHEYVVTVSADVAVVENDFDNNDRHFAVTVAPGMIRGLDLEVTQSGIVFAPSHPLEDEPIRVSAAIRNRGDVAARDAVVELYAVDALRASSLLHTFSGVDVAAKGSVTLTLDGVRLEAGTYDMYVIVSSSPAQQDETPDNNIAYKTLNVFDSQDVVDLAVEDFTVSPAIPHAGDSVFVRFRITNHGTTDLEDITFGVYDGDPRSNGALVLDSLQTLAFLGAGQSLYATGLFDTDGRGGEQTLYVFVDAEQAVKEVDEENNITSGAFTVEHDPGPDIVINAGGLEFSPAQPSVDDELRIYCTVCNQGSRPVVDSFDAALYACQPQGAAQPLAVATIDSLEANSCVRIAFTAQAALFAASQGIFAHADCQNAIVETNEYNNTVSMEIPVSSPDLSISDGDLSIESDTFLPGQPFALNAVIHNVGAIDATDVAVTVFNGPPENAQERARVKLPLVAAGSSKTAVFSISLPAGAHTLHVVVDPDGFVAEFDTSNNSASRAVTVGLPDEDPVLDLAALRVRLNSNNLPDSAAITVRVSNGGTVDVDPGIAVAFYNGDPAAGAILLGVVATSSALVAGAYEDVTFIWDHPAEGDYQLFVVADDDATGQGHLSEIDETNNTAFATFTIRYSTNRKDRAVLQGAQWLVEHQHPLGGWEDFSPAQANAVTLKALHISGLYIDPEFSGMYSTILQRVHETQATNGSWENSVSSTADSVLALLAVGEDNLSPAIRNAAIWLKRYLQGGWNNYSATTTGHALWALMEAGESRDDPAVQKARQWLLDICNSDGFWGFKDGESSSTWTLHYPVVALQLACDESDSVAQAAITKAVNWYNANREALVNHNYAYLAMLFYTGRNAGDIATTLTSLKGLQSSNGGWVGEKVSSTPLEEPRITAEAVISLYLQSQTGGGAAIRKAFRWLKTMMVEPAGDLQYPYDQASPTSSALLALHSVNGNGEHNETIREALTRLVNTQKSNGNWHLQLSMIPIHHLTAGAAVLKALAETELVVTGTRSAVLRVVDFLFRYQNNDGGWYRTSYAGRSEVSPTIVSLLGLLSDSVILTAGQRTDVQQAIEWLLQQKTGAANWETISHTANIVTIFERLGGYQSEIDEAVAWLKQRQNPDGGWGEYESTIQITAGVVLALIQTGNQGPETARAVQWLLAVQNSDGGWPILAGIPNSSTITTACAVRAVALADYTPGPEIAISFDKSAYQPGEKVAVSVEPKGDSFQVQQVSGTITEYEGDSHSIAFAKVGRNFVGTHVLSAGHTAGTDIVSIEAQTLEGVSGYGVGTFVVENKSDGFADLSVAGFDIMFSPEAPDEGRVVLIAARVHNIGLAASRQTAVRFLHGTQQIGVEQTLSSLAPGASDIVFMQWDTRGQLGRNYIHVVLDPDRLVADADRVNNRAMRPIDVAARSLPDLEVRDSDVSFANASPVEGAAVEVSATVRNLGADVDGVVVHFYEGSVGPENLIAERIVHTIVPFGESATVSAVFDTAGRTGQRSIIVKADPGNVIREQDEANNTGTGRLDVIPCGLALELSLDRESYAHAHDVLITACITNSFAVERTVQLDVAIRDGNGTVAAESAQGVVVVLPPGGTEVIDHLVWNTGSAMSGEWSVAATLFEDARRRAGAAAGFTIIADKGITAAINSDRQVYYDHEQVVVSSGVRSYSPNYAFTDLSALVEIISPDGQTLHANTYDIPLLQPLASTSASQSWNTALNSPGLYVLNLDIMQKGSLIASDSAYITIAGSASGGRGLSAFLNVEPAQVHRGQDVALSYGVRNSGNIVLDEKALVFKAVNVTTQQETTVFEIACMFEGNDCSGTVVLDSSDLACGDYVIILSALVEGSAHNLAFAPLNIVNRCPVTVAGEDVMAHVGDLAQVNGSASYDFDGDSLSYSWEKASAPEESSAELVGPGLYNPVLHIDRHGTYELRLSVSDGMCQSPPDSVLVTTQNRPPVAIVGESLLVEVGETVQLDGSASHDPDGDVIKHCEWTIVTRPAGSAAALSDRFAPNPVFTADVPGEYRLQLIVRDFEYASDPVELVVTTINRHPIADAGPDREVNAGEAVQLDASASQDPDADPLTCGWSILSAPQGSMAVISDSAAPSPVFTVDKSGTYIVQLIVNDGELDSIPDTCTITTRSLPPECTDDLGVAQQYSIFALGEVTSQHSTVSGRIAAGGDAELNNVVMGTHVPHGAPAEPVLVSGGDIVYSSGVVYRGSIIAAGSVEGVSDKVRRTMARGATIMGNAELLCDFTQELSRLRQLSVRLGGLAPTGTASSFATILTLRGDGVSPIQIFSINAQQVRSARSLHLSNIPRNATVIINISGQQAEVSHIGMAVPGWLTGRVLFNFFEARSLEFTAGALKGSVLAPLAQLTGSSGIMFGSAVVGAWQGSMNVGHEPFIGILPKCEP